MEASDNDLLRGVLALDVDLTVTVRWASAFRGKLGEGSLTLPIETFDDLEPLWVGSPTPAIAEELPWLAGLIPADFFPVRSEQEFWKKSAAVIRLAHAFPPVGLEPDRVWK